MNQLSRAGAKARNPAILGIAAIVLIAAVALAYREWRQYHLVNLQAAQARDLAHSAGQLYTSLLEAETGQRGYLLTDADRYLEPYQNALRSIPGELATLRNLLPRQPDESSAVTRLIDLANQKLAELRHTIEIRRTQGAAAALAMVLSDRGKQTMDEIRAVCQGIQRRENASLAETSLAGETVASIVLLTTVAGSLFILFLLAFGMQPFASRDPHAQRRSRTVRYGAAVATVFVIVLFRMALTPLMGDRSMPFTLFFPAVWFAAWFGGLRPGLLSVALSGLAGAYFFAEPTGSLLIKYHDDQIALLMLVIVGFGMGLISRSQQRAVLLAIEAQHAERDQRQRFETTLASIGDAVIATDAQARVTFANHVACALMGYPEMDIIGRPLEDVFRIVNEATGAPAGSPVARVLREGGIAGLANHTTLIARDGTAIPIDDSAAPIKHGGRTIGVVLVFRDISERRRAQQDAAFLAAIVESSHDAVIGMTVDGAIQTWNSGAERLYGYQAAEMVGHSMRKLLPPDRHHEYSDILERLRAGERLVHLETKRLRKSGDAVDVMVTVSPIRNKTGDIVGFSHVGRDLTEQKRHAEQMRQTQKLESLGVLAGGIAHDFNNLLTGILGNASLIVDELPPASPLHEAAQEVVEAGERAAQLASQMLAYSGRGRFVLKQIDLSAQVRETLPLIKASIPPTVELKLDLSEPLPLTEADAAQIQQLIMNIIINAAEAIPEGASGTVTIATRREQVGGQSMAARDGAAPGELAPGLYVVFEVSDTGIGMDEETQSRIFDPFFTTKFTGRGLGLAAVLGIVRGHRGSIQVSSTLGKGTVFRVLLPASEAARESKPALPAPKAAQLAGTGLVLVVDDEAIVRHTAAQALERHGYTVVAAENGARGLDIYRREAARLKCVVLDLTMPVMSGEEALAQMKALRSDIPIILSSGFNEIQAVERFQGKGLAGFLQKPYKASDLVEKVTAIVSRAMWHTP